MGPGHAALVGSDVGATTAHTTRDLVESITVRTECVGSSVTGGIDLQRLEISVARGNVTDTVEVTGAITVQVVAVAGDRTRAIRPNGLSCYDTVGQCHRAADGEDATADSGRVATDGAVDQQHHAVVVDATALGGETVGGVATDGAINQRQ